MFEEFSVELEVSECPLKGFKKIWRFFAEKKFFLKKTP
jgi:hypothetical protein